MIAAFVLFGIPSDVVFPAVLCYRVIAFWLPIPPGHRGLLPAAEDRCGWERERETACRQVSILQKVK